MQGKKGIYDEVLSEKSVVDEHGEILGRLFMYKELCIIILLWQYYVLNIIFMYKENRMGARTEPRGTHSRIYLAVDDNLFHLLHMILEKKT